MPKNAIAVEVKADRSRLMTAGQYYLTYHEGETEPCGMIHACPCDCGAYSALFFEGKGRGRPEWKIEQPFPAATLSPSIGIMKSRDEGVGGFHWHGYLRNGVFEEC